MHFIKTYPIADGDINAYNSFEDPDKVTIKPHQVVVNGASFRIALPAMSVATVTLTVGLRADRIRRGGAETQRLDT